MIEVKGSFTGVLRRADGTEEVIEKDNLIVSAGYDLLFNRLFQTQNENYSNSRALQYIAVGTGANAAAPDQKKLTAFLDAMNAQYFHTAGTKECKVVATFGTGRTIGAITEAAVCYSTNNSGPTKEDHVIFDRVVFPAINKGTEDVYTCTFKFVLAELKEGKDGILRLLAEMSAASA